MSNVTNLTRFRKDKARAEKRAAGDANAAKFGRSKAQRQLEEVQAEKARITLDAHRREDDPPQ
jgi:exonuclease V gamma subunit